MVGPIRREEKQSDMLAGHCEANGHTDNQRSPAKSDDLKGKGDCVIASHEFDYGIHYYRPFVSVRYSIIIL